MVVDLLARVRAFGLPAYGDDEVRFVEEILRQLQPTHVFEWGTNVGASARLFYEAALEYQYPCEVHTVELPLALAHLDRDHPGEERYGQWIMDLPIHTYRGDGLTVSLKLYRKLKPEWALFFIDGYHSKEQVLKELLGIFAAAPTAAILLHDTHQLVGPLKAIREFDPEARGYTEQTCSSDSGMTMLWPLG